MDAPKKGLPLISSGDEWWLNASLHWSEDRWRTYIVGFRDAARQLVTDACEPTGTPADSAIFPIAFMYRHLIELQVKHLILRTQLALEKETKCTLTHDLVTLWEDAKELLNTATFDTKDQTFQRVTDLIKQFSVVDATGESFRYPTDRNGNATLDGIDQINIRNFGDQIEEVVELLEGLSEVVFVWLDAQAEARAEGRFAAGY